MNALSAGSRSVIAARHPSVIDQEVTVRERSAEATCAMVRDSAFIPVRVRIVWVSCVEVPVGGSECRCCTRERLQQRPQGR